MAYEWRPISRGDPIPGGAVQAGSTPSDGDVYVGRVNGEAGKLNTHGGSMYNIWCHDGGSSDTGDILVVLDGAYFSWTHVSRGDDLPSGAVLAGTTSSDGDNYVCRSRDGEAGKVNVNDGSKVHNFWYHGHFFSKGEGDVLEVHGDERPDAPVRPPPVPVPQSAWNPDAECDGARAEDRAQWLADNRGMSMEEARAQVMQEFPFAFHPGFDWWRPDASCDGPSAEERAQWLMQNEGFSHTAAKIKVRSEFPSEFGSGGGDFVADGKFPHALSLVETSEGPKLKIEVVVNTDAVSLVAVHYEINGGQPMNFDITRPDGGSRTYSHVTPHGGGYPVCRQGDEVSYWLAAEIDGLISEEPEGACGNGTRLTWTAHH